MPSLDEIRQFNNRLIAMGDEPEVVREWGEDLEDVAVPDAALDDDLSSLLSDSGELDEDEFEDATAPAEEPSFDESPDFSDLLGAAEPEETDEPVAPETGEFDETGGFEPPADEEPFDFDQALFGDESNADELPEEPEELGEADEFSAFDEASEVEEADEVPDFEETGGFVSPEVPGAEEPPGPDEPTAADDLPTVDEGDFSDFEALLAPDEGEEGEEPAAEETEPALGEPEAAADEFGLPEAEDAFGLPEGGFSFDDELDESGGFDLSDEDELGETPLGEAPAPTEPAAESPEPDDEFGMDLPDFDEGGDTDFDDLGGFEFSDEDEEPAGGGGGADDFSFEEPVVPGAEGAEDEFGTDELGELDEVGEDELDEFSLGDFGAEFGVLEEGPSDEDLNPAINVPEVAAGVPHVPSAAPGQFELSEDEFARLQAALAALPLNLKQDVERVIAEAKGTTEEVEKLCRMLVDGESAQDIATYAGRILGKKIRVPRGYEKRSGEDFEVERRSFSYQFRENIWPILRLAGIFVVVAGALGLLGYNFVFRPLYARSLYAQGLELIEADQYSLGNQTFDRAWEVWADSDWYYEYADEFIAERQYTLAEQKYQELLFSREPAIQELALEALESGNYAPVVANHPLPKRGVLEYAHLESEILGNYAFADRLINLVLFRDTSDYDARLALGDNFMRWADEDPSRFEDARLSYARLIERYGQTDELLFRMLRYFIATDNLQEVVTLKDAFQADPRARINPQIYAELAGYLIDNELLTDVEDVVFRAMDVDRTIPELHYHLARYYRQISAFGEEELALGTARTLLGEATPFTPERRAMLVDTHTRIGETEYAGGEFLDAQEEFSRAIELYEQGRERRILGPDAELARVYARLGDIFYYVGREYELALAQFDEAEANGYREPDLDYKQGFVHYRGGRLEDALTEFREAADDPSASTNALLWATANTHFRRENLFASEAYYRELIDRVERERDSIRTLLVDEDSRHQSVIEYMYRGYNNLGVALFRLSEVTGDPDKFSESLVYLTRSTELAENYQRDQATLTRSDAVDLAFLNQREALYPRPEFEMQIYNEIPEDLDDLVF
ncbi:MAG: periplasmic flagellar collar protein FlcA [Spirochaetota bacterium]